MEGQSATPWGIATLTAKGTSYEPLLCHADEADTEWTKSVYGGLQLLTFADAMSNYADCLTRLYDGLD